VPYASTVADLVLHGPRVLGCASTGRIAARFGLDEDEVEDLLLEFGTRRWVSHARFADTGGWYLTEDGKAEDERRMAKELDAADARTDLERVHADFVPLNVRFSRVTTDWQVRPHHGDDLAANDHTDWAWDDRVLRALTTLDRRFARVAGAAATALQRFDGYAARYSAALAKVDVGRRRWVDDPEVDSCHTVWIQFHEDLLATLGIPRGDDDPPRPPS